MYLCSRRQLSVNCPTPQAITLLYVFEFIFDETIIYNGRCYQENTQSQRTKKKPYEEFQKFDVELMITGCSMHKCIFIFWKSNHQTKSSGLVGIEQDEAKSREKKNQYDNYEEKNWKKWRCRRRHIVRKLFHLYKKKK